MYLELLHLHLFHVFQQLLTLLLLHLILQHFLLQTHLDLVEDAQLPALITPAHQPGSNALYVEYIEYRV